MEAKRLFKGYFVETGVVKQSELIEFVQELARLKIIEREATNWKVLEGNEKLSTKDHSVIPSRGELSQKVLN